MIITNNLGIGYKRQDLFDKAIPNYKYSLNLKRSLAVHHLPNTYNNLATGYLRMQKLDSANLYIDSCILSTQSPKILHHAYTTRGRIYELRGILTQNPDFHIKAILEHNQALKIRIDSSYTEYLFNSYMNLGANHDYLKNYEKAKMYYSLAIQHEAGDPNTNDKIRLRDNISSVYFNEGQYSNAISYLNGVIDSIRSDKYGELNQPEKQGYIEKFGKYKAQYEVALLKERLFIAGFIGLVLLTAIISFIIYRENKKRRKLADTYKGIIARHTDQLAEERVKAQEDVLRKIGRELHDGVQNYIWAWQIGLCEVEHKETRTKLVELADIVRKISHQLSPFINEGGLIPSIQDLINQLNTSPKLAIELHSWRTIGRRFFPKVELNIYRIVQEALTNILKHAKARQVSIQLIHHTEEREYVSLIIEDNGKGFVPHQHVLGIGLSGMRDRVEELGGTFLVDSSPGKGTTLIAEIPAEIKGLHEDFTNTSF